MRLHQPGPDERGGVAVRPKWSSRGRRQSSCKRRPGAWQQVAGGEPGEPSIPDSAPPEARRYRALGSSRAPTVALRGQLDLKGARRYRRPGTGRILRILRILRREYKYGYYMS